MSNCLVITTPEGTDTYEYGTPKEMYHLICKDLPEECGDALHEMYIEYVKKNTERDWSYVPDSVTDWLLEKVTKDGISIPCANGVIKCYVTERGC